MSFVDDGRGWSEEFSVNVKLFDTQHQRLIGLIDRLEAAMREGRGRQQTAELLAELADYTWEHFASEEAVLKAYDFPWRDMHALEHRQFSASIERLRTQSTSDEPALNVEVLHELKDWFRRHVLGTDRMYVEHLNTRGLF